MTPEHRKRIEDRHAACEKEFKYKKNPQFGFQDYCLAHEDRRALLSYTVNLEKKHAEEVARLRDVAARYSEIEDALSSEWPDASKLPTIRKIVYAGIPFKEKHHDN